MTTAILVDDMPDALQLLQSDLEVNHADIKVIGTATSVVEAAKLLRNKTPDILFLDIMLGDGTGFDILEILPELKSKIIFVTASDEYAIKAFKFAAIDYILKPYSDEELAKAIEKAIVQLVPNKERLSILKDSLKRPSSRPKKISLSTLEKISVIDLKDIIRCESDNNNTKFFLEDGTTIFVTKTLKYFADLLIDNGFVRTHQSHLININAIKEFIKSDGGYLILKNNKTIPVSVRKRVEVVQLLTKN